MTLNLRFPVLAGAMTAAFCLATLAPTASQEVIAQGIRVYVAQPQNYAYGSGYTRGYDRRYSSNPYGNYGNSTYGNTYRYGTYGNSTYGNGAYGQSAYGQSAYGNGTYGSGNYRYRTNAYSGIGQNPYGYGASTQYAPRTSSGYGYQNGTYNSLYYRAQQLRGGTYSSRYNTSIYTPYGSGGY